jgi:V8-like Glu-specific endopeptidase
MRGVRGALWMITVGVGLLCACARLPTHRATEPSQEPAARHDGHASDAYGVASPASLQPLPPLIVDPTYEVAYVVRIVAGDVTCSGTLIYEDRVLTAHHCVAERNKYGEALSRDLPANRIRVELGGDYMPWGEVGVRAVIAPPCGYDAGLGDIAILVLERELVGITTLTPRLERSPRAGESVDPVGFGRCALESDGIRRRTRQGGKVQTVMPTRFRLRASICPGDSGGPVVGDDGALVGVISTSVIDGSEQTAGLSEFTRVDQWRPVFSLAKLISEGASLTELPPLTCTEHFAEPR